MDNKIHPEFPVQVKFQQPADGPILFAVRALPVEAFGERHGRQTRKFVLMTLASYADPDGSRCFPSIAKLAKNCGLHQRSIQKIIRWLRDHGLLTVTLKAGPSQASVYSILIPEVTPSSGRDELQRASRPETHGSRPETHGVTPGDTRGHALQRAPNLPIDQPKTNQRPTKPRAPTNGALFVLPDWVPVVEWRAFEEMRKKKHNPMTDHARELAVRELARFRDAGDSPADVLDQSVLRGWAGVFPLNRDQTRKKPSQKISEIDYQAEFGPTGKLR